MSQAASPDPNSSAAEPAVDAAVIIPVKAFDRAKVRLKPALDSPSRQDLARTMATHVVTAAAPLPVSVVCDDDDVAAWAESVGAEVIWCPGTGLNGAVQQGFAAIGAAGRTHAVVAHSDLPLAGNLAALVPWPGVTLVPDRHRTGTNVIALPTTLDFTFAYGTGSFTRHVIEAVRQQRGMRIVHDPALGWDVDYPADLDLPKSETTAPLES